MTPVGDVIVKGTLRGGREHGDREVDPEDIPAQACKRNRVPASAAAEVEHAPALRVPELVFREPHQDSIRE